MTASRTASAVAAIWFVAVAVFSAEERAEVERPAPVGAVNLGGVNLPEKEVDAPSFYVEIQLNVKEEDTADNDADDYVCLTNAPGLPSIRCRAKLEKPLTADITVVLVDMPGGGEVRFPRDAYTNKTLTLSQDGMTWTYFDIAGVVVGDAKIEAHEGTAEGKKVGEQELTVFKVDLLVNDTEAETDDYVAKEKPSGTRTTPWEKPAGATDNHIPMKVRLLGPSGFSCKVKLSDTGTTGTGDVTIKKTDGSTYPTDGEAVTVGTDLDVHVFGAFASAALNDVTIEARTDKTADCIYGQEDLTVIWIDGGNMSFRGSAQQDQAFTPNSQAQLDGGATYEKKVGSLLYYMPPTPPLRFHNQEEIKITVSPDVVITDVSWAIPREISRVSWGPGSDTETLPPSYNGKTDWEMDRTGEHGYDLDLVQDTTCRQLFTVDTPGYFMLPLFANYRWTYKAKFQEWVEVKIGSKWYVCSPYKNWKAIQYLKCEDATTGWKLDATKTTEIIEGTLTGFAGSWSE